MDNAVKLGTIFLSFFPACSMCIILPKACVSNAPGAVLGRKDDLMVETPEIKSVPPCASLQGMKDVRVVNCLFF